MRIVKYFLVPFLLFQTLLVLGQEATYKGNPDSSFLNARDLAFSGNRKEAQDSLKQILTVYPEYIDVRNLLAKTYSWEGNYDSARKEFNKITSLEKGNKEVWIASINNELYAGNFPTALGLSNKALVYLKGDADIIFLQRQAFDNISTAESGLSQSSHGNITRDSLIASQKLENKNRISIYNTLDVFDIVFDPMIASSIEFKRETKMGSIVPRINYAHRFDIDGLQYEIDLYPKFSKSFYGYLNYGFSLSTIFPDHRAGAELYANLPNTMEISLGGRYLEFNRITAKIITASAGWYSGNYYFSLRPYLTLPEGQNRVGFSGSILMRNYLKDKFNYLGLNASAGYAPELRQLRAGDILLAQTLLHIESQQLNLEYQFTGLSERNTYRANLGVIRQELAFDPGKFVWAITAGFAYQVKF